MAENFFVQGECNCKRCRDERKLALSSLSLSKIEDQIPFLPRDYDANEGFGNQGFSDVEDLDNRIDLLLSENEDTLAGYLRHGILKSKTRYCADCGRLHRYVRKNKVMRKSKPRYLCKVCMHKYYRTCVECKTLVLKVNGTKVRDEWYCMDCAKDKFERCENCGDLHNRADLIEMAQYGITDWRRICPKCFEAMTCECSDCGTRITIRTGFSANPGDPVICKNCKEKGRPVHSYSYKPRPIFHFDKNSEKHHDAKFYFGMEIEVELRGKIAWQLNADSVAKKLLKKMGKDKIYMKSDSSLGGPAFEIVTYPQSWAFYKTMKQRWTNMLTWTKENGGTTESGKCGIHIHINKASFTTMHTYKFIDFVYKQVNMPFIMAVSSRKQYSGTMRSYANLYVDNGCSIAACKTWAKEKGGTGHHSAVDVSGVNQNTYEMRIFNGTLDPDIFHKNIEFVHSLWKYTRDCASTHTNVPSYMKWLLKRNVRNQYVHLVNFLLSQPKLISDYGLHDLVSYLRPIKGA